MFKVFYEPKTLQIKGFSSGELSLDFPFIVSEIMPIMMNNWKIEIVDEVPKLLPIKESFTKEEWEKIFK